MRFDFTIGKLQHIQNIDDIPWGGELVYNKITCFSIVIDVVALVAFPAQFLEAPSWKKTTILLTKKKTKKQFI